MIHSISEGSSPYLQYFEGKELCHFGRYKNPCQGQIKNCEEKRFGTLPNVVVICREGHLKHSKFERANMGSLMICIVNL